MRQILRLFCCFLGHCYTPTGRFIGEWKEQFCLRCKDRYVIHHCQELWVDNEIENALAKQGLPEKKK